MPAHIELGFGSGQLYLIRAISHLSVRLTAMYMTVNEVSSPLCKILALIIVNIPADRRDATESLKAQL